MAREVDQRVIDMRFQNQDFERNARQSMRTLQDLKRELDLQETTRGFDELEKKSKKFSLSGIAEGVAEVSDRFSTMGIIGMRALQNITDAAMRTGKQLISAFTIDPVKTGFAEYETQINATQTILANTKKEGAGLDKVNAALNELNKYADQTIYNFTEMTRNIGTFTAAGVKLDTSVAAIKGIANLAAVSGSTSEQASRAMYQLSQALASGTVKLMDWNSVVNAGMGGQVFQDALIETARVHGVAIDEMIKKEGSFRETLQKGWLTSEVLTETLAKFTGDLTEAELLAIGYTKEQAAAIIDMGETANQAATKVKTFTQLMDTLKEAAQSGWTQSWQIMIGDFEEAKELLTSISDYLNEVIGAQAQARNDMLQSWSDWGGRQDLIDGLRYALEGLLSLLRPIHEAFKEIFPPITGFQLAKLTRSFRDFTAGMKLTSERADEFRRIFKGVFAIMKAFSVLTLRLAIGAVDILIQAFGIVDGTIYSFAASLGDGAVNLANLINEFDVASKVLGIFQALINAIKGTISTFGKNESVTNFLGGLNGDLKKSGGVLTWLVDIFKNFATNLTTFFSDVTPGKLLTVGLAVAIFMFAKAIIGTFVSIGKTVHGAIELVTGFGESISKLLGSVSGMFKALKLNLQAKALFDFAASVALVVGSLYVLNNMDKMELLKSVGILTLIGAGLAGLSFLMGKFGDAAGFKNAIKIGKGVLFFALAITTLTGVLKLMETLDTDGLAIRVAVLGLLAGGLTGIAILLSKFAPQMSKGSIFMISFAASMLVLVQALKGIEHLDVNGLIKSVSGLVVLMGAMAAVSIATQKAKFGSSAGILATAIAIRILASAVVAISEIDGDKLAKGLIALTAVGGIVVILSRISTGSAKIGAGIMSFAIAVGILTGALKLMETLNMEGIEIRVLLLGALAAGLAAFSILMSKFAPKMSKGVLFVLAFAESVKILVSAIRLIDDLSAMDILKGVATLTALMGALTLAMRIVGGTGSIGTAASVLALSFAVNSLIKTLDQVGRIDAVSVLAGVAVLTALVGGMLLLTKIGGAGASMSSAVTIFAMSAALLMLAGAVDKFSHIDTQGLGKAVVVVSSIMAVFGVFSLVTKFAGQYAARAGIAILAMATAINLLVIPIVILSEIEGDRIRNATLAISLIIAAFSILVASTHLFQEAEKTILYLAGGVAILSAAVIALSFIEPSKLFGAVAAMDTLVLAFGALVALTKFAQSDIDKSLLMLLAVVGGLGLILGALSLLDIEASIPTALAISMLMVAMGGALALVPKIPIAEAAKAVGALLIAIAGIGLVVLAVGALMQMPEFKQLLQDGGEGLILFGSAIGGFFGSIIGGFFGGIAAGATSSLPFIAAQLSEFAESIQPFLRMTSGVTEGQMLGVRYLCDALLSLTGAELLSGISRLISGGSDIGTFGDKLKALGEGVKKFYEETQGIDPEVVEKAGLAASAIAEFAKAIPNEGGLLGKIVGENDIEKFGEKLAAFAPSFVDFCQKIQGAEIDHEMVEKTVNLASMVSAFARDIPNTSGGLIGMLMGEKDLTAFGTKLMEFAPDFVDFCEKLNDAEIDHDTVEKCVNIASAVTAMANGVPVTEGGLVQWINGNRDLADFGTKLTSFGDDFSTFAESIENIPDSVVEKSEKMASAVAAFAAVNIPASGGILSWFTGSGNIETFGAQLVSFGSYFKAYWETIADIDPQSSRGIISHLERMVKLTQDMTNIDRNKLAEFVATFGRLADDTISKFTGEFDKVQPDLYKLGTQMMLQVLSGAKDKLGDFQTMGEQAIKGFTNGIRGKLRDVRDVSTAIGTTAEKATKDSLGIHSPSLIFKAIAAFVAGGFITGMDGSLPDIRETMQNMVDNITGVTTDGLISSGAMASVGSSAMNSLAKGISKSTTPEEAAKAKADAIVQIFQAGLDQIDLNFNTKNLEYQLWEALNPGADEATKAMMNMALLSEKIEDTKSKVELYRDQYLTFLEEFGEADAKTQEQYNNYLQAQIDLANLSSELANANAEENKRQMEATQTAQQARKAYYDYMRENQYLIEKYGITHEQLMADATRQTGYDPNAIARQNTKTVDMEIQYAITRLQDGFGLLGEEMDRAIMGTYSNWSETTTEAIAGVIQQQIDMLNTTGENIPISIVNGITDGIPQTTSAMQQVVAATNAITETELINQPSITPVLDDSKYKAGVAAFNAEMQNAFGVGVVHSAQTASSFNSSLKNKGIRLTDTSKGDVVSSAAQYDVTYIQNIYSPTAVNRTAVQRDTKSLLAQSKNS